jgi:CheY-like chemotaxis protein
MSDRRCWPEDRGAVPFLSFARPARVLLADAEDRRRLRLAEALTREGYLVEETGSGLELCAQLVGSARADEGFDLVIADLELPGRATFEVLARTVRAAQVKRASPCFILIARRVDDEVHLEAARLGAVIVDYWFDVEDVRDCAVTLVSPMKSERAPGTR